MNDLEAVLFDVDFSRAFLAPGSGQEGLPAARRAHGSCSRPEA